nr:permease prefix domain 1-containing protein [Janibacter cremeus]
MPDEIGPDVARELRGALTETIEAKVAAGTDPREAELAAVRELGDPDVLAREYLGRPSHLIGPRFYAEWVRVLTFLLSFVLPVIVLVTVGVQVLATDKGVGALIGTGIGLAVQVALHLVFWTTLAFALVERYGSGGEGERFVSEWDPADLADPDVLWRRPGTLEVFGDVLFGVIVTLLVVWQFAGVGGRGIQVLDPDLSLGWQATVVGLLLAEVAATLLVWMAGRWRVVFSLAHAATNVALAVVLIHLVLDGRLLTDLPQVLGEKFGWDVDWSVSTPAVVLGVVVVCGWDVVTSLTRLVRSARMRRHRGVGQ